MDNKKILIRDIMDLLDCTYKNQSGVYNVTKKGLEKLSYNQLNSLWAMIRSAVTSS